MTDNAQVCRHTSPLLSQSHETDHFFQQISAGHDVALCVTANGDLIVWDEHFDHETAHWYRLDHDQMTEVATGMLTGIIDPAACRQVLPPAPQASRARVLPSQA